MTPEQMGEIEAQLDCIIECIEEDVRRQFLNRAAPALLEAVEDLLEEIAYLESQSGLTARIAYKDGARAAIALAKGNSE